MPFRFIVGGVLLFTLSQSAVAAEPSFSDVPPTHPAYSAVEFLKEQGIIGGYDDGTFRPDNLVDRAAATKVIVAPRITDEALAQFTETPFTDIPDGAWFLPYVEVGRQVLGFIDGPPQKTAFRGQDPVLKGEFMKMLLAANDIDAVSSYSEIKLPLSDDVANPDEWYYPYMRYAITASMTMIGGDGNLSPGKKLTRGDVALLLHRFLMYRQNRRTQALLSATESDIILMMDALQENNIVQAEYASARALLTARGAHASRPDDSVVIGALKVTEAFRSLIRAYRAGLNQDYDTVTRLTGEAWNKAAQAAEIHPDMQTITQQVQESAHDMAESARELQGQE